MRPGRVVATAEPLLAVHERTLQRRGGTESIESGLRGPGVARLDPAALVGEERFLPVGGVPPPVPALPGRAGDPDLPAPPLVRD